MESSPVIPVVIDDVKRYGPFSMTRCSYFTIECGAPSPDWTLVLDELSVPFLMMGLSGVIWKPLGRKKYFRTPGDIDLLFDTVEGQDGLYVDTNDIWIPNELFEDDPEAHGRGSLFRVGYRLFVESCRFREDRVAKDAFLGFCKGLEPPELEFSRQESEVFRAWVEGHIEEARGLYLKDSEHRLKWRGEKGEE